MQVKPKKYFGQHFLKNPDTAKRISDAIPAKTGSVLEVGPGKGILTQHLLQRFGNDLKVIEIDRDAVAYLKEEFPQLKPGQVIEGDFLKLDLENIFADEFHLCGNFPYNISSQILFRMLENRNKIPSLTGMFQKEVALRIAASPGSKVYGILSVLTQAFYQTEVLFSLSENEFFPPPKVKSAVIRLIRNVDYSLGCDEAMFFKVVKTAFQQRRKTLRNSLKVLAEGKELPEHYTSERPEQLGVSDFCELTRLLSE